MLSEFQEHIKKQFPVLLKQKFLLACSGGLDSVVLAHLCQRSEMKFELAHCNFNLRGIESDGDESFVRDFSKTLEVNIFVTHFNTKGYVGENKVSIEMAARELRYAWFAEVMKENGIEILVTAHHSDDNLETFLINLSRGTGIDGLKGIPDNTNGILRPLLPFSRTRILEFAVAEDIKWREDSTNTDTVHLRNKIRHQIVPKLKELHPTFLENFRATQSYLSGSSTMLSDYLKLLKAKLFEDKDEYIRINIEELAKLHPLKSYLHGLFGDYGFRAWNDIENLLEGMSGKEVRSKTHRLVKDREYLLLEEFSKEAANQFLIQKGETKIKVPIHLQISEIKNIEEIGTNILYVDIAALNYPLVVRKWKKGDYFYPLGMVGKKKLSKYFKDEKVDVISKEKQWLLCSDHSIIWVIGKRADNRFKVTKSTEKIVKFIWVK